VRKREATHVEAAPPSAPAAPARPSLVAARRPWDGLVPEVVGLALVLVLLGGMTMVGLLADWTAADRASRWQEDGLRLLATTLAHSLGQNGTENPRGVQSLLADLSVQNPSYCLRWTDEGGRVQFETPAFPNPTRAAGFVVVPVRSADGRHVGRLELGSEAASRASAGTGYWRGWWLIAGLTLCAFLVLYRELRRHLRPAAAIHANLRALSQGLEKELLSLRLSESFGDWARAWNALLHELAVARQRQSGAGPAGGTRDLLRSFESRRLGQVLNQLPFGAMRVDGSGRIIYANAASAQLLGSSGDLSGTSLAELVPEPAMTQALSERGANAARGLSFDHVRKSNGRDTAIRLLVAPLDADGPHGERLITLQDISHLHEAQQARDNFLYHVTHELRTPLTNIQAYAETLSGDFDDEQMRKECYNIIMSETRRLSRLVEDILSVSQLEVGTARMEMGDIDLARLLRQAVQDQLGAAEEKGVTLGLSLPPKLPGFRGDKQRIAVLLTNLIGNGVKYTPSGGKVQVTLEADEESLRIVVADTGVGIDPADQPHVFEKFYRATSDAIRDIPGTGLGLAIAREVARVHGGDIRLQSEPGRGSTFSVELPRAREAHAGPPAVRTPAPPVRTAQETQT
jgi:PAS domain S-box-containing protein